MQEKSRISRKPEPNSEGSQNPPTDGDSSRVSRSGAPGEQRAGDMGDQLVKTRQELEKAIRTSRSLARNCARAEQEARRREVMFDLVCRHGSDLVFRLGRDGKFQELSPACAEFFGHAPEVLAGRFFQEFIVSEDLEPLRRYFQSVLRGTIGAGIVLHLRDREQRLRTVEMHCRAVPHPQTQVLEILAVTRLVGATARSPGEELAYSLAHELNQPLTALAIAARACSQLAREDQVDAQELMDAIDELAVQSERAGELVRRMRQLGGARGASHMARVQVQELIKGTLRMLEADLKKEGVTVTLQVPPEIPMITIDRIQIEQVLVNLIRNAVEAMTETPTDRRTLTISASLTDAEFVLALTDTGRGLSPEVVGRLFQPYQTTKPNGMGLGLAVSMAVLQAHAGRLWVEPTQGPGTTFCLALPLSYREI